MYHTKAWCPSLGLLGGLLAMSALAADRYAFDEAQTEILFFVDRQGASRLQGGVLDYDGDFRCDPADWGAGPVQVAIRAHSIDMDYPEWNQRPRGKDFFRVVEYPEMSFKSPRAESNDENRGRIHAEPTLLGAKRPTNPVVRFDKAAGYPINKRYVAGFSASTRIKRAEFGMTHGLHMVRNEVETVLEAEGFRQTG